jgi:hypothetical protein
MLGAIVGHLVGDYLLQNDWMALNKKKLGPAGFLPCFIHCSIWTLCVIAFGGIWSLGDWRITSILLLSHYFQDGTNVVRGWMSLIGQEQFATGPCAPWSIIVVDNVWHIVTIFSVWTAFGL